MSNFNIIKIRQIDQISTFSKIKFEFHIANKIRRKYEIEDELFTITGNVVLANFYETRKLALKINSQREENNKVTAGEINAVGLLDEIYHFLFDQYQLQVNPGVFKKAINHLNTNLKEIEIDALLKDFVQIFPPISVYRNEITIDQYLEGSTENKTNKEIVLEEFILLHFANLNTAANRIKELYNDEYFINQDGYSEAIKLLDTFFQNEEKFGPENQDIFTFFKTPILKEPYDLGKQLDFIFEKWKIILTDEFLKRILRSQDLFKEEYKLGFGGAPPTVVPKYKGQ
ncbi:MAG: hypothetical protein JXA68_08530, partial [Ignavibacteriales bacterium]|nr:hypothetical protein [Ignavibacteriales bacterium]